MKSSILATMSILLLCLDACSQKPGAAGDSYSSALDLPYRKALSAETHPSNAFTLDIYSRPGKTPRGVVVFIHGGGWMGGDKSNIQKNPKIVEFFIREGFALASVNFRLPQREGSPRVTYRDQANDIASAIKWLSLNIEKYGGDPKRFVLFGYSSGAHLTALLSTDEGYLGAQGLRMNVIERAILMDVHTYDIPSAIASMKNSSIEGSIPMIKFLFGETASEQKAASPAFYADRPGKVPFLLISAGVKDGASQNVSNTNSEAFAATLKRNGREATHVHFASRSHVSLVMEFGTDGDRVTAAVKKFLDRPKTSSTGRFPLLRRFAKLWLHGGSSS